MPPRSFPQSVLQIMAESAARFPSDIPSAIQDAFEKVTHLDNYMELIPEFVKSSIHALILAQRHIVNTQIKRDTNYYHTRPKVIIGSSKEVAEVHKSVYEYCIGSSILGDLTINELMDIASREEAKAKGHLFNVSLMTEIYNHAKRKKASGDSKVRDAISEKHLRMIFQRLQKGEAKVG